MCVAGGSSDLNKRMKTLALPMAMSISFISNRWALIFGGKASLNYSNTFSFDISSFCLEHLGHMQIVLHHVWCYRISLFVNMYISLTRPVSMN